MIKISVIIPTRNRCDYLRDLLKSIEKQTLEKGLFEVIVFDNGSADETKEVCNNARIKLGNLRYIYDPTPGLHVGRNRGFKEARGEYLVYADDDIIASETWLEGMLEGFEKFGGGLVTGNDYPLYESEKPSWIRKVMKRDGILECIQPLSCVYMKYPREVIQISTEYVFGCNYGVRKSLVKECKGFHPDGMPRELLMYRGDGEGYVSSTIGAKGHKAYMVNKASVYHRVTKDRLTEKYIGFIKYRNGISHMYSCLRLFGIKRAFQMMLNNVVNIFLYREDRLKRLLLVEDLKGMLYLFYHYLKSQEVRVWIKKDNYL